MPAVAHLLSTAVPPPGTMRPIGTSASSGCSHEKDHHHNSHRRHTIGPGVQDAKAGLCQRRFGGEGPPIHPSSSRDQRRAAGPPIQVWCGDRGATGSRVVPPARLAWALRGHCSVTLSQAPAARCSPLQPSRRAACRSPLPVRAKAGPQTQVGLLIRAHHDT